MRRVVAVAVALVVTGTLLAPVALAADAGAVQASGATAVDDCTTITSSGEYELADDVASNGTSDCIEISADDVVLDGNGHTVAGPGADAGDENAVYRGIFVNWSDDVVVRNVVLEGWSPGIRTDGAEATIEDSVVRDGDVGIFLEETGPTQLSNVTVRDNEGVGIDTHRTGDLEAVDVTIEGNDVGLQTWDAHGLDLRDSRVVDNDDNGINLHHHSSLNLTDVTVDGNAGDGINVRAHEGFDAELTMDGGTVSDNGGAGIAVIASATAQLTDVTVSGNDELEVAGAELWQEGEQPRGVTASDLAVGSTATTDFENESIGLEPVAADALPDSGSIESPAGDGLNVSGPVDGPVALELDVDSDVDTVDLMRYDGTDWAVAEADLPVTDGSVETTVDRNGTYAPVESGASDGTGDETSTATPTPGDQEKDKSTPTPTPGDQEKDKSTPTPTPGDQDKSKSTPTPPPDDDTDTDDTDTDDTDDDTDTDDTDTDDGSSSDGTGSSDSPGSADASDSSGSSEDSGTSVSVGSVDPSGSAGDSDAPASNGSDTTGEPSNETAAESGAAATSDDDERQQSADADSNGSVEGAGDVVTSEDPDEESTFGAGNGFGTVVALLALVGVALLATRRR